MLLEDKLQIKLPITPEDFGNQMKEVEKFIGNVTLTQKDTTRIISLINKETVFQKALNVFGFDSSVFKLDILGNLVMKNISNDNISKKKLAYDIEHILSHSHNGKTSIDNSCLLVSAINRNKKANELYKMPIEKIMNYIKDHGISPYKLLDDLNFNFEETRKKYNLYFTKVEGQWTVPILAKTKKNVNIYTPHSQTKDSYYYKKYIENSKDSLDTENYELLKNFYETKKPHGIYWKIVIIITIITVIIISLLWFYRKQIKSFLERTYNQIKNKINDIINYITNLF